MLLQQGSCSLLPKGVTGVFLAFTNCPIMISAIQWCVTSIIYNHFTKKGFFSVASHSQSQKPWGLTLPMEARSCERSSCSRLHYYRRSCALFNKNECSLIANAMPKSKIIFPKRGKSLLLKALVTMLSLVWLVVQELLFFHQPRVQ